MLVLSVYHSHLTCCRAMNNVLQRMPSMQSLLSTAPLKGKQRSYYWFIGAYYCYWTLLSGEAHFHHSLALVVY